LPEGIAVIERRKGVVRKEQKEQQTLSSRSQVELGLHIRIRRHCEIRHQPNDSPASPTNLPAPDRHLADQLRLATSQSHELSQSTNPDAPQQPISSTNDEPHLWH
jgi:hypothetical protein